VRIKLPLAVAAAVFLLTASVSWAVGELTRKSGKAGCISMTGDNGTCEVGRGFGLPRDVAISPDGRNAYVPNGFSDAVAVFDRNPATGELSQKAGAAGCISQNGAAGCLPGNGLDGAAAAVVSPDGRNVYVASFESDAVAIFSRDPVSGALSQAQGQQGCISEEGVGGCLSAKALDGPIEIAISPDGADLYVASFRFNGLAVLRRLPTGELRALAGDEKCVSEDGTGGRCKDGIALVGPSDVEVSPDGANVYVASRSSDAVAIFDRDLNGVLTQKGARDGCVSESGSSGACQDGVALVVPNKLAISSDGENVYVLANANAVSIFDRDATGRLTQKSGTAGCLSDDGTAGACQDGAALIGVSGIAVAPGGETVYVASAAQSPISIFDRDSTGALAQKPGLAGCISDDGSGGGCRPDAVALRDGDLTVSPDGRNLYFADNSSNKVSIFDRALPSPPPADTLAPTVTGFRAAPKRFKVGPKKRQGTRFRFVLSEPAGVGIEIERARPGRRIGKRCKPPTPTLKGHRPCRIFKRRATLTFAGGLAGANTIRFSGRIGKRTLRPGAYRGAIVASDAAGNRSTPSRASFTILPQARKR
jgi:DNA-binding beta-propeller fold protein YncE